MTNRPLEDMTIVYATTIGSSTWSFLNGQLKHFREKGADVHVICSPDRLLRAAGKREDVITHGIRMEREIAPIPDALALANWVRTLWVLRPNVVNVGTPKAALLGLSASWLLRVPIRIYTIRGLRYETTHGGKRRLLELTERLCCALSTHNIAVSHGVAKQLKRDAVTKAKLLVIGDGSSNGVRGLELAAAVDSLNRSECRKRWQLDPEDLVVGFVGRITPDKGGDCLREAIAILKRSRPDISLRLLIVGDIEDDDAAINFTELENAVYTGWIDDTAPAYAAMDILCLPTRREGFPNVVLEAGAAARPVVTSDATGAEESVVHGETGLIVPIDDAPKLAEAIADLADSPVMRRTFGHAARERVLSKYQPSRIWNALERLYLDGESTDITEY